MTDIKIDEVTRVLRDAKRMYDIFAKAHEAADFLAKNEKYANDVDKKVEHYNEVLKGLEDDIKNKEQKLKSITNQVPIVEKQIKDKLNSVRQEQQEIIRKHKKELTEIESSHEVSLDKIKNNINDALSFLEVLDARKQKLIKEEQNIKDRLEKFKQELKLV